MRLAIAATAAAFFPSLSLLFLVGVGATLLDGIDSVRVDLGNAMACNMQVVLNFFVLDGRGCVFVLPIPNNPLHHTNADTKVVDLSLDERNACEAWP
jgi:hypothetical protein